MNFTNILYLSLQMLGTAIATYIFFSILQHSNYFQAGTQHLINFNRKHTSDAYYKMMYRTGEMDADTYREWQKRGYINDDLDPKYLK